MGALDVVSCAARVEDALLDTVLPRSKLMPAVGPVLPDVDALGSEANARWQSLFDELGRRADLVIVDTPAGTELVAVRHH